MMSENENEKRKTVADILAEYRNDADAMDRGELYQPTTEYLRRLLDRIKAAWEREREELDKRISDLIEQALSAPARNCDRYKDAPSAYADFIVPWKLDGHLDDVPTLQDFANWLFAPAAERKGE